MALGTHSYFLLMWYLPFSIRWLDIIKSIYKQNKANRSIGIKTSKAIRKHRRSSDRLGIGIKTSKAIRKHRRSSDRLGRYPPPELLVAYKSYSSFTRRTYGILYGNIKRMLIIGFGTSGFAPLATCISRTVRLTSTVCSAAIIYGALYSRQLFGFAARDYGLLRELLASKKRRSVQENYSSALMISLRLHNIMKI